MTAWSERWKLQLGLVVEMQQKLKQLGDLTRRQVAGKLLSFLSVIYSTVAASYFSVVRPWLNSKISRNELGMAAVKTWSACPWPVEQPNRKRQEIEVRGTRTGSNWLCGQIKPLQECWTNRWWSLLMKSLLRIFLHSYAVITHSTWISLHKLKLSLNSPCLWALVSPSNPCFIPNLSAPGNWAKLGTPFNELWHCGSVLGLTL